MGSLGERDVAWDLLGSTFAVIFDFAVVGVAEVAGGTGWTAEDAVAEFVLESGEEKGGED